MPGLIMPPANRQGAYLYTPTQLPDMVTGGLLEPGRLIRVWLDDQTNLPLGSSSGPAIFYICARTSTSEAGVDLEVYLVVASSAKAKGVLTKAWPYDPVKRRLLLHLCADSHCVALEAEQDPSVRRGRAHAIAVQPAYRSDLNDRAGQAGLTRLEGDIRVRGSKLPN